MHWGTLSKSKTQNIKVVEYKVNVLHYKLKKNYKQNFVICIFIVDYIHWLIFLDSF